MCVCIFQILKFIFLKYLFVKTGYQKETQKEVDRENSHLLFHFQMSQGLGVCFAKAGNTIQPRSAPITGVITAPPPPRPAGTTLAISRNWKLGQSHLVPLKWDASIFNF